MGDLVSDKDKWLEYRNRISMGYGLEGEQTRWVFDKALEGIELKEKIISLLDSEIKFAKGTGMPQFVMGLLQAKRIILDSQGGPE